MGFDKDVLVGSQSALLQGIFRAPAESVLYYFAQHHPEFAAATGISPETLSPGAWTSAAAVCWLAILAAAWLATLLLRRMARLVEFGVRSLVFHLRHVLMSLKTSLLLRYRRRFGGRRRIETATAYSVDLSDADISVLAAAASLSPAHSTSAPDLVECTRLRPAEIQQSLEKLYRNKLLDSTMGSTDGFENYVISASGAALHSMMSGR